MGRQGAREVTFVAKREAPIHFIDSDDEIDRASRRPIRRKDGRRDKLNQRFQPSKASTSSRAIAISKHADAVPVVAVDYKEIEHCHAKKNKIKDGRKEHRSSKHFRIPAGAETVSIDDDVIDIFEVKEPPPEAGDSYYNWCVYCLCKEFPRATMSCVKQALKGHKRRLGPAYRALYQEYQRALSKEGGNVTGVRSYEVDLSWLPPEGFRLNKCARSIKATPRDTCPFFDKEFAAVKSIFGNLNDREEGIKAVCQDIECGCCFSESPFEQLVQCADGHLFCFGCLRRHVEEATFGGGQAHNCLPCMDTAGCTEVFPWSEVERALPPDVLTKYEKRLAEDSIARARLQGLVYCPFCNFPCEVDPGLRVLDCPNSPCRKSSCLKCKEPSHVPLKCEEVEKKTETSLRRHIEELMTKALIRECVACKAELVKTDGCNKITCRCRQIMCYVCRKAIEPSYKHFCQHPREPGKPCTKCSRCGLWDQEESDAVVKAAKEAAVKEAAREEPNIVKRKIGPDDHRQKKRRLSHGTDEFMHLVPPVQLRNRNF